MRRFLVILMFLAAAISLSPPLIAQDEYGDAGPFFLDIYGGKERFIREDEFPGGRCAPLLGTKIGYAPRLSEGLELELGVGGKFNTRDTDNSAFYGDIALNGLFGRGFFGGGLSFWDLNLDERSVAGLIHTGVDLTENRRFSLLAEGRVPLDELDDTGNNYMFWGGLRIRLGGADEGDVVPPPPAPPTPPPAPPAPPAAPTAPAPPEFVWPEVYFPFDQYVLTPESRSKLDSVADYMNSNPDMNVTIEGHCCYIGTDEYNLALGQHRADAIKDYLVGKGIAEARLRTVSYGESRPKYDNEKEITRRFNRRGFFVVLRPDTTGRR